MKPFENVLVYVNPENQRHAALAQGAQLARHHGAKLTLVTVMEISEDPLYGLEQNPLREEYAAQIVQQLEGLAEPLRDEGLDVQVSTLWGRPFQEVIRAVLRDGYDLVLKTAEGVLGLSERLFGTTALRLFRTCPCPVWVVKPEADAQIQHVAAAVDLLQNERNASLNKSILTHAALLAEMEQAQLHLVHTWEVWGQSVLQHRISLADINEMIEGTKASREKMFEELVQAMPQAAGAQRHLIRGETGEALPAFISEQHIDVLVMGTVGRAGVPGLIIGNTAESLLHRVACSVLALKPEGFVSPVTL